MEADELFENTIAWLKEHYGEFRFFAERDVVWTVQKQILREIESHCLPYRVFNDYTIVLGKSCSRSADLVILNNCDSVEVAVEFKYEPDRARGTDRDGDRDIWHSKLETSVVSWSEVEKDIKRIQRYFEKRKAKAAYSVFIDEGGRFYAYQPQPSPRSEWIDWGQDRWVLWAQASRD